MFESVVVSVWLRASRALLAGLLLGLSLLTHVAAAQIIEPTSWSFRPAQAAPKVGEEVELIFSVKIIPDWYLYSSDFDPDLGVAGRLGEWE